VSFFLNGNIFIPESGGVEGGYGADALTALARIARRYAVNLILVESNFGDGMFAELLKPYLRQIYPCGVEETHSSKQKELRIIDTLEPVMNQHRLIVDPSVIQKDYESAMRFSAEEQAQYMLFYQMTRISKDRGALKHDDRLDALAMSVAYWVEKMGMNQDEETKQRHDQKMEEYFRLVDEAALYGSPNIITFNTN
jgi:hypothetical protein